MDEPEESGEDRRTYTVDYQVVVEVDEETGNPVLETWTKDGVVHRENGPAIIMFDHYSRHKVEERWMRNGEVHRDGDKPAWCHYDLNSGNLDSISYYKRGKLHRDGDRPAQISFRSDSDGALAREEYWIDGQRHRDRFAAVIVYDRETGGLLWEKYYKHGYELSVLGTKPIGP
jgi:antitoxin component YwqK of YwqJK toxin-antitoxin module